MIFWQRQGSGGGKNLKGVAREREWWRRGLLTAMGDEEAHEYRYAKREKGDAWVGG